MLLTNNHIIEKLIKAEVVAIGVIIKKEINPKEIKLFLRTIRIIKSSSSNSIVLLVIKRNKFKGN